MCKLITGERGHKTSCMPNLQRLTRFGSRGEPFQRGQEANGGRSTEDPGFALGEDALATVPGGPLRRSAGRPTSTGGATIRCGRRCRCRSPPSERAGRPRARAPAGGRRHRAGGRLAFLQALAELPTHGRGVPGRHRSCTTCASRPRRRRRRRRARVFVRCRPLREEELAGGEYEAVELRRPLPRPRRSCATARCSPHRPPPLMTHRTYACDGIFGPADSDERVCDAIVKPLLQRVRRRKDATVILRPDGRRQDAHARRSSRAWSSIWTRPPATRRRPST